MPWHVSKSSSCPASKPWAVIKDSDSSVVGCHATKAAATKQLAALNAQEGNMTNPAGPYRDDLCREVRFSLLRADDDASGDGLTISGYAAVFDVVAEIDSWEGTFEEEQARGSWRKSLRERTPRMQFDHGYHPLIGSIPIGRWKEAAEDARGVFMSGRLTDNWLVEPVRDAIADEAIDGMSFRFSVVREEWRDKDGKLIKPDELMQLLWNPGDRGPIRRTLKEVKVSEAGPVVWPAYETTSVGVRSKVTIDLGRLGDPNQRKILARAVYLADAALRSQTTDAPPPEGQPSEQPQVPSTDAPPPTEGQPGEHPSDDAPPASEPPAGEHPFRASTPANPVELAADIKARYRAVTDRYLALSKSSKTPKETAA